MREICFLQIREREGGTTEERAKINRSKKGKQVFLENNFKLATAVDRKKNASNRLNYRFQILNKYVWSGSIY